MAEFKRIQKLREKIINTRRSVCYERAKLVTETYAQTEADPMIIRRAKALRNVPANMTIYIDDDELIVGNQACVPGAVPVFPKTQATWLGLQIDDIHRPSGGGCGGCGRFPGGGKKTRL